MENVLAFERVVEEFETVSPSKHPDELKTDRLQVTISDKTTYSEIKQSILGHDQATKTWASEQVIKSLEMKPHDPNGPQPMEVDSVNQSEDYKGKGKGKNKGKHGGWIPWQPYGRGKGGLKGKSKAKAKARI